MNLAMTSRRADAAREQFEEERRGEVLRLLHPNEIEAKAKQLGAKINERDRLDRDRKDQAKIANEQIKNLDQDIHVLACETEYGKTWVPSQQQFDGLWGSGGLVPDDTALEMTTMDGEVVEVASVRKPKARARASK